MSTPASTAQRYPAADDIPNPHLKLRAMRCRRESSSTAPGSPLRQTMYGDELPAPGHTQRRPRAESMAKPAALDFSILRSFDSVTSQDIQTPKDQLLCREAASNRGSTQPRPASAARIHRLRRSMVTPSPESYDSDTGSISSFIISRVPSDSAAGGPVRAFQQPSPPPVPPNPYLPRADGDSGGGVQAAPAGSGGGSWGCSRFHSEYHHDSELGHGNFSKVYKAVHRLTGVAFAIKTNSEPIITPQARIAWVNEMQALAAVQSHPHIVGLYDAWFEPDGSGGGGGGGSGGVRAERAYLKLELCGPSLGEAVRRRVPMPEQEVVCMMRQMASALKRIHEAGMVHLDIKPDNIYMAASSSSSGGTGSGSISGAAAEGSAADGGSGGGGGGGGSSLGGAVYKLGDFGLAVGPGGQRAGWSEGDCRYLAPETLKSRDFLCSRYADRLDIFALGASAYELLRGSELPKNGQLYHDIRAGKIVLPGCSQRLVALLKRMMASEPQQRPSADQLLLILPNLGPRDTAAGASATTHTNPHPSTGLSSLHATSRSTGARSCPGGVSAGIPSGPSSSTSTSSHHVQPPSSRSQQQRPPPHPRPAFRRPSMLLYQVMHRGLSHPLLPRPPPPCVPMPLGPRLVSARQSQAKAPATTMQQQQQR